MGLNLCPHCTRLISAPSAQSDRRVKCPHCQQTFSSTTKSTPPATGARGQPADAFDPYYTWLGIPPRDQPPHHYRLLGLEPFETNLDAIDNASNRQMAHLRNCSAGRRAAVAQELLNKVAAARVCLLDASRKVDYDARLREELAPHVPVPELPEPVSPPTVISAAPPAPPESVVPPAPPVPPAPLEAAVPPQPAVPATVVSLPSVRSRRVRTRSPTVELVRIVLGGLVGLGLGYVLAFVIYPNLIRSGSQSSASLFSVPADRSSTEVSSSTEAEERVSRDATSTETAESVPPVAIANGAANRPVEVKSAPPVGSSAAKSEFGTSTGAAASPVAMSPDANRSASIVPPAAASGAHELAQFPASVALPPIEVANWQTLLPLPKTPDRIELVPAFDPNAARMSLKLEAAVAACDSVRWKVLAEVAEPTSSSSSTKTVCELQIDSASGDLQFQWESVSPETAAALANSWLQFAFEEQTRFLALRHPQRVAPLKLSFDKGRFVVPLMVESVPVTSHLVLDVSSLAGLPGSAALRNGASQALIDREVVIEFSDLPGAQIAIKLSKVPQAPLGLIVEPRFKEAANREYDLTYSKLVDAKRGVSNALADAQGTIARLTKILETSQPALRAAKERKVQNKAEALKKALDISRLDGIVRNSLAKLRGEREKEADAQSRLDNVPKIEKFIRSLDGREIFFRVAVKSDSAELVLVKGANDGGTH